MSARKPLVLVNGQVQQLQNGDTLDAPVSEVDLLAAQNAEASAVPIGTPVYIYGNDSVKKARANAAGTAKVKGLVKDSSIEASATGNIQTDGLLTATTGEWDAVTGGSGGLTAGADYFLDAGTAGRITATAPSTAGQLVVYLGTAISTTELELSIERPILL